MGVNYSIIPLDSDNKAWHENAGWFEKIGLENPATLTDGRNPTLNEILKVANSLPGHKVEHYSISKGKWQITIEEVSGDGYVILECLDYRGKATEPRGFYVYRGHPWTIVLFMKHLANICGPFLVIADDGISILVTTDTDPKAKWSDAMSVGDENGPE